MRRGPLIGTLSLLCCLNHLSSASLMSLRSGFQNHFILDVLCSNALIILILFLQIFWIVEFTRPNSRHTSAFLFSFAICHITNFSFKTFLLFVTVAMSSRYQSPVNCRSRNVDSSFAHKVNYLYYCHFQA
jgi:hypothetical protein